MKGPIIIDFYTKTAIRRDTPAFCHASPYASTQSGFHASTQSGFHGTFTTEQTLQV
jgi:hypothetical protein